MTVRALVTGGAGFIGQRLVRDLITTGWQVRVLDDLSTGTLANLPSDVELILGDVRKAADCARACSGMDHVFHLAARVSVRQSVDTFIDDAEVNLHGTLQLLRAASEARVRRFVLASSMAVYADAAPDKLIAEDHPTQPLSPYGVAKLAAERYVLMLGPRLGLEPVVLRLFNTIGPGQGFTPYVGVATIFVTHILRNEPCVIYDDGSQCRDFVYVGDVATALRLAATVPTAVGEIFNIGTGQGTTVNRLAQLIGAQLGRGQFTHVPRDATELRYSVANIAKANRILGYSPQRTIRECLPEVIAGIRAHDQAIHH